MTSRCIRASRSAARAKKSGKRHPTLGNNVMVGVNAAVLGSITIHDNSKVGGGAVVVEDVPENCTVVGVPARVVVRNGKLVQQEERRRRSSRMPARPPTADVVELQARVARLETLLAAQAQGKTIGGPAKNHSRRCVGFRITRRNRANLQLPNP